MYWNSTTNSAPIKIWTTTRSHLKKEFSGLRLTLRNKTYCSQENCWPFLSTAHSYAPSTRHQVRLQQLQIYQLPLLQSSRKNQKLRNKYRFLCEPELPAAIQDHVDSGNQLPLQSGPSHIPSPPEASRDPTPTRSKQDSSESSGLPSGTHHNQGSHIGPNDPIQTRELHRGSTPSSQKLELV